MSGMLAFHISVHARPAKAALRATPTPVDGRPVQTLAISAEELATPFAVSFEQAGEALANLPRLFFEPDGSFVWVSARGEDAWQVDGNLFDRAGRLQFIDLKGRCPPAELERLLSAFGWPQTAVMFQLVRVAVFLEEAEFRRVAEERPTLEPSPFGRGQGEGAGKCRQSNSAPSPQPSPEGRGSAFEA